MSIDRTRWAIPVVMVTAVIASAANAAAQGCILIRESAPVIGSMSSTYLRPGEWEVDFSLRGSTADRHYSLDVYQAQRQALGTNVINKQHQAIFNIDHAFTKRFSLAATVPFVQASWSIPSPTAPSPGPRATQHGAGLGDISAIGRFWLFDTTRSTRNLSIGVGVKAPTGNAGGTDTFVDITGANSATKAVDQSVQPGDGGWGTQLEVQGFSRVWRLFAYGSANYLINPRDMNGTPSILVGLGRPSASTPLRNQNSVPDQYVARGGAGVPIWKGLGASFGMRVEGVPRYDLIGRSDGFRRPGHEVFVEPGVTFNHGSSTVQFELPRGVYRYRAPDPYTGANGDATFPDWVMLGTYSYRFGSLKHQQKMPQPRMDPSSGKQDKDKQDR